MKFILVIAATLLLGANAQAQLRKCTGPDGRVSYSDVACATTSKTMQTLDAPPPGQHQETAPARNPSGNVYERELSGKIAGYLLQNDFDHATTLAVTVEHFQMIADARQSHRSAELARNSVEIQRKAAIEAAKPTRCRTFGVTSGYAIGNSYSGNYAGTTVCKK